MDDKEIKDVFVKRLRHYIELSGKQQKEIAKDLNIPVATFNNWCTGRIMPRIGGIDMLAKYFDVPRSDLLIENGASTHDKLLFELQRMPESYESRLLEYIYFLKHMDKKDEN